MKKKKLLRLSLTLRNVYMRPHRVDMLLHKQLMFHKIRPPLDTLKCGKKS